MRADGSDSLIHFHSVSLSCSSKCHPGGVKEELQPVVMEKQTCAAIKMKNEVLYNDDIFQNVL